MGIGSGLAAQFGVSAAETVVGTPVAVTRFFEHNSEGLGLKRHIAQGQGLRAGGVGRRAARRIEVAREANGDFEFDLPTNGLGVLLQHMLGSYATTATQISASAAWQQIHNTGSLQGKTFTVQSTAPDTTGYAHPFTYPGCKVVGWEITAAQHAIAKLKVTIDGMDEATESQLLAPTTLSSSAIATATSISTVATIPTGTYIQVGTGANVEYITTGVASGAGPFTIPITSPATGLKYAHASAEPVGGGLTTYPSAAVKAATAVYGASTGLFTFKDARIVYGGSTSVVSGIWTNTSGLTLAPGTVTPLGAAAPITPIVPAAVNGTVVRNISLKGANPVKNDSFGAGLQVKKEQIENNFRDYTGSLDVEFNTREFYDMYQTDGQFALVLTFQNQQGLIGTSGNYPTLQFYLPAVKLEDSPSPDVSGPDIVIQKLAFTALDDGTNGILQALYISSDVAV